MRGLQVSLAFLLAATVLAGCSSTPGPPIRRTPIPGPIEWSVERSMLPGAAEADPATTFPMVFLHSHRELSARDIQYQREHPFMCSELGPLGGVLPDQPFQLSGPASDSEAASPVMCLPAPYDAGTGRLFVDRAEFASWHATAVFASQDQCGRLIGHTTQANATVQATGPFRSVNVTVLANRTLLVDGHLFVHPREVLKGTYGLDYGAPDANTQARLVIDYAGFWLDAMVAPRDPHEPPTIPRPTEGTGTEAWIPMAPATVSQAIDPLWEATRRGSSDPGRLWSLRASFAAGQLTDLRAVFVTGFSDRLKVTSWFVAGRTTDQIHLLARVADGPREVSNGTDVADFQRTFGSLGWDALLAKVPQGQPAIVQLDPGRNLQGGAASELVPQGAVPCNGRCDYTKDPGFLGPGGWDQVVGASDGTSYGNALSLVTTAFDPAPQEVAFHWAQWAVDD